MPLFSKPIKKKITPPLPPPRPPCPHLSSPPRPERFGKNPEIGKFFQNISLENQPSSHSQNMSFRPTSSLLGLSSGSGFGLGSGTGLGLGLDLALALAPGQHAHHAQPKEARNEASKSSNSVHLVQMVYDFFPIFDRHRVSFSFSHDHSFRTYKNL